MPLGHISVLTKDTLLQQVTEFVWEKLVIACSNQASIPPNNGVVLFLATLGDLAFGFVAQLNSFILSNIVPQYKRHNQSEKSNGKILYGIYWNV